MCIGSIIRSKQPDVYKQLMKVVNKNKSEKYINDNLSIKDFEKMMKHDSYKRVGGAIKQVRHK